MQIPLLHQQIILQTEKIRELHRSLMMHASSIPANEFDSTLVEIRRLYESVLELQRQHSLQMLTEIETAVHAMDEKKVETPVIPISTSVQPVLSYPKIDEVIVLKSQEVTDQSIPTMRKEILQEQPKEVPLIRHTELVTGNELSSSKKKGNHDIHELYEDSPTLGDRFQNSERLADKLAKQPSKRFGDHIRTPIKDLRAAIGLNEKFQFINQLFGGDSGKYNAAVEQFNGFLNLESAHDFLNQTSVENNWENHAAAASAFVDLVERRYMS